MEKPVLVPAVCPQCNAQIEVNKNLEEGFCNYCGTKILIKDVVQSVKLKGKVKIDNDEKVENYYQIARRAAKDNNSEQAEKYYDMILQEQPNSWEAAFYVTYFKAMKCKIMEIGSAAASIYNTTDTVLNLIKDNESEDKQIEAIKEISDKITSISCMLFNAAKSHYDGIDYQIKYNYTQEYLDRAFNCLNTMYNLGNQLELIFPEKKELADIITSSWEVGINMHKQLIPFLAQKESNKEKILSYAEKIQKYNPNYVAPEIDTTTGGCYVATAVYGSYDCPQVWTLRRYRDNFLDKHLLGKTFIKAYYSISPKLIKILGKNKIFISFNKKILDKWVTILNENGYENTKYNDKY